MREFSRAPTHNVKSIKNWHYNHDYNAIVKDEQKYLDHEEDLFTLDRRIKTPLRRLMDNSRLLRTLPVWKHRKKDAPAYDAKQISYYSDIRMDRFACAILGSTGIIMLITPIWILQALASQRDRLIVITAYIIACLIILSSVTSAEPLKALGATAA